MIKVVLFDFGGVLSETGRTGFMTTMIAEVYGVEPEELDLREFHYAARRGKIDETHIFDVLNKQLGKQVTPEAFVEHVQAAFQPAKPVYELAERLRGQGIRTGIFSNVFAMNADELRKHGAYDGFDPIILSCEEGYAKPDQELYRIAIQKCDAQPDEIILIDDQLKCTEAAEACGMYAVLAQSSEQIVADTEALIATLNHNNL
jgi:epoxide hydrolase-like predicted phosphatase